MSRNDWLHCNGCAKQPDAPGAAPFFFTTCEHIYCTNCTKRFKILGGFKVGTTMATCPRCARPASFRVLNKSLPEDLQMYFRKPTDIVNDYMHRLNKVLEFQSRHRANFANMTSQRNRKCESAVANLAVALKESRERVKSLEQELAQTKTQTAVASVARPVGLATACCATLGMTSDDSYVHVNGQPAISTPRRPLNRPLNPASSDSRHPAPSNRRHSRSREVIAGLERAFQDERGLAPSPILPVSSNAAQLLQRQRSRSSSTGRKSSSGYGTLSS